MIYTPILLNSGETRVVKNPCKPIPLVQPNLSTNPSLSIDFVNHFGRHQIHYGKPIPFQLDIGWRGVWPINLTGQSLSLSLSPPMATLVYMWDDLDCGCGRPIPNISKAEYLSAANTLSLVVWLLAVVVNSLSQRNLPDLTDNAPFDW